MSEASLHPPNARSILRPRCSALRDNPINCAAPTCTADPSTGLEPRYFNFYYSFRSPRMSFSNACGCFTAQFVPYLYWLDAADMTESSANAVDGRAGSVCSPGSTCSRTSSTWESHWYSLTAPDLMLPGTTAETVATKCTTWCTEETQRSCAAIDLLLNGAQTRCGFDSSLSQCALFVAKDLASKEIIALTGQSVSPDCAPDVLSLRPCPSDPAAACVGTGVTLQEAEAACASVTPASLFNSCVFDFCATGGDPTIPNNTITVGAIEVKVSQNRPPSAPSPPSAPGPPSIPTPSTGTHKIIKWGPHHCITDPATGKNACIVLPEDQDINSNSPKVQRAIRLAFKLQAAI